MIISFPNLRVADRTFDVSWDLSDADTRYMIRLFHEHGEILSCAYHNMLHYEKFGGLGGAPEVRVDARTEQVLKKLMEK